MIHRLPISQLPHRCVVHNKSGQNSFGTSLGTRRDVPCRMKEGINFNRTAGAGVILYDATMQINIEDLMNEESKVDYNGISYTVMALTPTYDKFGKVIYYTVGLKK